MGKFDECDSSAAFFGPLFLREIMSQKPKEIIDIKWLEKYIDNNPIESSMDRR